MWIQNWFQKDKNKERIGQNPFPSFMEPHQLRIKSKDVVLYLPNRVLTQNGVPVKVKNAQLKPTQWFSMIHL